MERCSEHRTAVSQFESHGNASGHFKTGKGTRSRDLSAMRISAISEHEGGEGCYLNSVCTFGIGVRFLIIGGRANRHILFPTLPIYLTEGSLTVV